MRIEEKYLNEEKKYKIQIKDLKGKWVDQTPKGRYNKDDAELIMKKEIKRGKHSDMIKVIPESNENDVDILDRIEIEELIKETEEFMKDGELSEKAANIVWGKSSIEKFGKTIGKDPNEKGFFDACTMRMKGKKGFDKEGANKFCASILDKYKGNTNWRGGHK